MYPSTEIESLIFFKCSILVLGYIDNLKIKVFKLSMYPSTEIESLKKIKLFTTAEQRN